MVPRAAEAFLECGRRQNGFARIRCPRCGVEMIVVSVITDPRVVDRILHHREQERGWNPFAERPPPATPARPDKGRHPSRTPPPKPRTAGIRAQGA